MSDTKNQHETKTENIVVARHRAQRASDKQSVASWRNEAFSVGVPGSLLVDLNEAVFERLMFHVNPGYEALYMYTWDDGMRVWRENDAVFERRVCKMIRVRGQDALAAAAELQIKQAEQKLKEIEAGVTYSMSFGAQAGFDDRRGEQRRKDSNSDADYRGPYRRLGVHDRRESARAAKLKEQMHAEIRARVDTQIEEPKEINGLRGMLKGMEALHRTVQRDYDVMRLKRDKVIDERNKLIVERDGLKASLVSEKLRTADCEFFKEKVEDEVARLMDKNNRLCTERDTFESALNRTKKELLAETEAHHRSVALYKQEIETLKIMAPTRSVTSPTYKRSLPDKFAFDHLETSTDRLRGHHKTLGTLLLAILFELRR